jgi:hypothetical protein
MTTELITDWSAHDKAFAEILSQATRTIDVFDLDLTRLPFERQEHAETLRRFIARDEQCKLRIVLRNPEPFRRNSPRLMDLLTAFPNRMSVIECPASMASLSESLFLVDDTYCLIRFHQDNVRSKKIDDDQEASKIYALRFAEIIKEGGEQISATTLGL